MKKCSHCKKKSIMIESCKCGQFFCLTCLPYFVHVCTFDHKDDKKKQLLETLPKILPEKIKKI